LLDSEGPGNIVPEDDCDFPFLTAIKYIANAITMIEARNTKMVLVDINGLFTRLNSLSG